MHDAALDVVSTGLHPPSLLSLTELESVDQANDRPQDTAQLRLGTALRLPYLDSTAAQPRLFPGLLYLWWHVGMHAT